MTPELLDLGRGYAAKAGVTVRWLEADAQSLPFADGAFDRVVSTFGAMFAPDHARAARELVRTIRPGGRGLMTTWVAEGFFGELFALTSRYLPPPAGIGTPPQWGREDHVRRMFGAHGATPEIEHGSVGYDFPSLAEAVALFGAEFSPVVMTRSVLEPQGRWAAFRDELAALVARFDQAPSGGGVSVRADYLLITLDPSAGGE